MTSAAGKWPRSHRAGKLVAAGEPAGSGSRCLPPSPPPGGRCGAGAGRLAPIAWRRSWGLFPNPGISASLNPGEATATRRLLRGLGEVACARCGKLGVGCGKLGVGCGGVGYSKLGQFSRVELIPLLAWVAFENLVFMDCNSSQCVRKFKLSWSDPDALSSIT